MKPIITLTMNPSLDYSSDAETVEPTRKIRCSAPVPYPGGGGVNVSRVIGILGGDSLAVIVGGGHTGQVFADLLNEENVDFRFVRTAEGMRASLNVFERSTGLEYRFVPSGAELQETEWRAVLEMLDFVTPRYLVLSGSLPRGVPDDFYARVARLARGHGSRVVLDTSGPPLLAAIEEGVHLVKPSRRELEQIQGGEARDEAEQETMAQDLVERGKAELVAVTLGAHGAILASKEGCQRRPSPEVEVRSASGAGDSFVAAMTLALHRGRPIAEAFAWGIAAGAATAMTPGTVLCHRSDVERLLQQVLAA